MLTTTAVLLIGVLLLAYSNGANDNFKGVATLWGSGTLQFRGALAWATVTTVAGSLASILLAAELAAKFKGHDLVPPQIIAQPELGVTIASAAAVTILLATVLGMPTSTTHALVGALLGAVFAATHQVNGSAAASNFFVPLLISPVLAVGLVAAVYGPMRWTAARLRIAPESCVCIGEAQTASACADAAVAAQLAAPAATPALAVTAGTHGSCAPHPPGRGVALTARRAMTAAHMLSGGAVCFSRALNDTPKIAALLIVTGGTLSWWSVALVTVAMGLGGLLQSRKVAATMSQKITTMTEGQGLAANLATAAIVFGASNLGLPVSTTHVSCGSIFGIGALTRNIQWKVIAQVLLAWLTTLPLAALLGALIYSTLI